MQIKTKSGRVLVMPTPEEDTRITAAALTDPDNLPLTDVELSQFSRVATGEGCRKLRTVWHYTVWSYLPKIAKSGELKIGNVGAPSELPLLWFSANQQSEPTALKIMQDAHGGVIHLTFEEQMEVGGCIRFGLDAADTRLMNWAAACSYAGTPSGARRRLEKYGKKIKANPFDWFAVAASIPLSELKLQVWMNGWKNADDVQGMADVWESS